MNTPKKIAAGATNVAPARRFRLPRYPCVATQSAGYFAAAANAFTRSAPTRSLR